MLACALPQPGLWGLVGPHVLTEHRGCGRLRPGQQHEVTSLYDLSIVDETEAFEVLQDVPVARPNADVRVKEAP